MRARGTSLVLALLVCAQSRSFAQVTEAALDATARRVMAEQHVVGTSVLVLRDGKTLLHRGYGFADLGLETPSKDETVYHIVGPMLPFTGVAVMQLAEQHKLGLDDELAKYIPEFPQQGHHVTIRQLLDHTSGVVDYHYLGDPIEATSRLPKALDEVMALYAGKSWVNEPGAKWDWSISGFQLLVTVVERVSGERFADYMQRHIFAPAKLTHTSYCDDFTLVKGLSHAYRRFEDGYVQANENDMAYNADLRFCSTVGDLARMWGALRDGTILSKASFTQMETPAGAAAHMSATDPKSQYGLALSINHEDDHRRLGQHGSLFGYSGSLYEFPADHLTIVVLGNTEGQSAYAISRALSRQLLGLPPLPAQNGPAASRSLDDNAITPAERSALGGTYMLHSGRLSAEMHDSYGQYVRTFRVFDENGRLMIQTLGEGPERLYKQNDGSFARRSAPRIKWTFAMDDGRATALSADSPQLPLSGKRVGAGDPATFHSQLR